MLASYFSINKNLESEYKQDVYYFYEYVKSLQTSFNVLQQTTFSITKEYFYYKEAVEKHSRTISRLYRDKCIYCKSKNIFKVVPLISIDDHKDLPWLVEEIRNLVPLCKVCLKITANIKFSISSKRPREYTEFALMKPNVLLPNIENCESLIEIDNGGRISGDARCKRTIKICNLNRKELVSIRTNNLKEAGRSMGEVNTSLDEKYVWLWCAFYGIPDETLENDYKNSQILRSVYEFHLSKIEEELKYISNNVEDGFSTIPVEKEPLEDFFQNVTIQELEDITIENARAFGNGECNLSSKFSIGIVGDNGLGKSTFIELFNTVCSGNRSHIIKGSMDGFIKKQSAPLIITLKFNSEYREIKNQVVVHKDEEFFSDYKLQQKIKTAFITDQRLNKETIKRADLWLQKLTKKQFDLIVSQIRQILGVDRDSLFIRRNNIVLIKNKDGSEKNIEHLSSGYKSILTIIYKIYRSFGSTYKLNSRVLNPNSIFGVIFIDEIEIHLHPKWKISIVSRLKRAFPTMLFVFTTHDPLVLKGCESGEVLLFKQSDDTVSIMQDLPDLSLLNSEQILTSPYFQLEDTSQLAENEISVGTHSSKTLITDSKKRLYMKKKGHYNRTYREYLAFEAVEQSLKRSNHVSIADIVKEINEKLENADKD